MLVEQNQTQSNIKPVAILIAFVVAGFTGLFSETALNMALGNLMVELNVVSSTVQWVTTGYLLTMGIIIPVSALLIQWFTTRQLFVASLLFSIVGAVVSGSAPSFSFLLLGRIIQAVGTGLVIPLMFHTALIILSSMILLHLYLQIGLGLSALTAGLILMPGGAINGLLSPVVGRVYDTLGPKWLFIPGFTLMFAMLLSLSNVTTETSMTTAVLLHSFLMVGVTMVLMPMQTHGLNALPANLYPDGTALINTLLQVSGSIGTALAITIMSTAQNKYLQSVTDTTAPTVPSASLTAGVQTAFILGITLAVIGFTLSFMLKVAKKQSAKSLA